MSQNGKVIDIELFYDSRSKCMKFDKADGEKLIKYKTGVIKSSCFK